MVLVTDWSDDEVADARRDIGALMRAQLHGSGDDIVAILNGAGDRGTRCIAQTLVSLAYELTVRLGAAVPMIADDPERELVANADSETLLERPGVLQFAEGIIARIQGDVIGGGIAESGALSAVRAMGFLREHSSGNSVTPAAFLR